MEVIIKRQYKANFLLVTIFFIGFFLIGILPWLLYGDGFWGQNTFLTVISGILGFTLFVIGYIYIYFNVFSFKPKFALANIVQGLNILLLLFTVDLLILKEGSILSIKTSMWIFITMGVFAIISSLYIFIKYKNYNSEDFIKVKSYIRSLDDCKYDQREVSFLVHYIFIGMTAVFIASDFKEVSDYILIFGYNTFFIYRYLKMVNVNKNKAIMSSTLSVILYVFVIFIFITFNSFTNQHVVIKSLLFVFPLIHLIPIIIKAYYLMILKDLANS